jgi:hypothetical protein
MADKKIKVKVDVDTDVEPSIANLKALKRQIKDTAAGSEEFLRLQQQIDDVQDSLATARKGAGNFVDVLGGLPGPIGTIGNQASGLIATLKQFGALKVTDLQSSFVELGKDLGDVAKGFFDLTGITKVYTVLNTALARSFVAVGVGETAAAAGAKAFAAALTATGIGALVVGLGLLIANWDKVADAITGATAESKTYEEAQVEVTKSITDFNKKLIDVESSFKAAKEGTISKEDALKKYNDTLGATIGYAGSLDQAEKLMASNTQVVIEGIKLRTQANVFYAKSAEAAAKAISGEGVDPSFWQTAGNFIKSGGSMLSLTLNQAETMVGNFKELTETEKKFSAEGDKLTKLAIENDKKLKKGLAKAPDFSATKKASDDALAEVKKGLEEARLTLLGEQAKELELVKLKYDALLAKAKKFGMDTSIIEQARQKENATIRDKYAKQQLEKDERAAKELLDKKEKALSEAQKIINEATALEEAQLSLKLAKGEIDETEYQNKLFDIRKNAAIKNEALVNDTLKKGLAKPIDFSAITKASNDALGEIKKGLEESRLSLLGQQSKELETVKLKYDELATKAKKYGKDTKVIEENREKEISAIKDKFAKQQLENDEKAAKAALDLREKTLTEAQQSLTKSVALEEAQLNLKVSKGEITESQYQQKLSDIRKNAAIINEALINDSLNKEQQTLNTKRDTDLANLQTALKNQTITQQDFDAKKLEIEKTYQSNLDTVNQEALNKNIEFATAEVEVEKTYQSNLDILSKEALAKNKEFINAQVELEKYKTEQKKISSEEERQLLLNGLQNQFEALDRANKVSDLDFEQDMARFAEQREILAEQELIDLANEDLTEFQKTEIRKKYADQRTAIVESEIATERAAMQAKHEINMAYLGLFQQFGNLLGQIAGKNKGLAIAGVVISQAAAIGQIIAQTAIANAKSVAASPLTAGMPWVAINTISAGLSIASTIAGAVKSIQQINSADAQSSSGGGAAIGSSASALPTPPQVPTVASTQAPQIQTQGGANPNTQLAQTLTGAMQPVRAYVVSQDITSQAALDRRTNRAATFNAG